MNKTPLFELLSAAGLDPIDGPAIAGLCSDSRILKEGELFCALRGHNFDGVSVIPQAIQQGASAILAPRDTSLPQAPQTSVPFILSDNVSLDMARLSSAYYKPMPTLKLAVTGTNGKTSVAHLVRTMLELLGEKAFSIGTLGLEPQALGIPLSCLTTPDTIELHKAANCAAELRYNKMIVEASSHGLDQYRLHGLRFDAAAFTNLSQDHLDYHETMQHYFAAKEKLFTELLAPGGIAILNADAEEFAQLSALEIPKLSYGLHGKDLQLLKLESRSNGLFIEANILGQSYSVQLGLFGKFQAHNLLAATGLLIASGYAPKTMIATWSKLENPAGRMEIVAYAKHKGTAIVDFAHTPDALDAALSSARDHLERDKAKLWVVFGAGGDRDPAKRAKMGAVAANLADCPIITDDNPRTECPSKIRSMIQKAAPHALNIGDREQAIAYAMERMHAGDVLLVAGKGHEQGQIIGDQFLPFDDRKVIENLSQSLWEIK